MALDLRLLASPRRIEILRLVWAQELAAGAIHRALGDVTFGAVSQHLRALTDAGLLAARREGRFRYYRALPDAVGELRPWLERMWDDALVRLAEQSERAQRKRPRSAKRAAKRRPVH